MFFMIFPSGLILKFSTFGVCFSVFLVPVIFRFHQVSLFPSMLRVNHQELVNPFKLPRAFPPTSKSGNICRLPVKSAPPFFDTREIGFQIP